MRQPQLPMYRTLLFWAGCIIIALAVLTLWVWPASSLPAYRELAVSLLGSTGVALVLVAIVESRHLLIALSQTANRIVQDSSEALDDKFNSSFQILDQCTCNGLVAVHTPRQQKTNASALRDQITDQIGETETLRIIGISALDFFGSPRGAGTTAGPFYAPCQDRLTPERSSQAANINIRVLLLYPMSPAAQLRNRVEKIEDELADIKDDSQTAREAINRLNRLANRKAVEYRWYLFPHAWAVLTDDFLFLEPYHFAPTQDLCTRLTTLSLPASHLGANCTGGRVPVFQFRRESSMYQAIDAEFGLLWEEGEHLSDSLQENGYNPTKVPKVP